jgi:eukaryotic-like serine/threonine-protein kinase
VTRPESFQIQVGRQRLVVTIARPGVTALEEVECPSTEYRLAKLHEHGLAQRRLGGTSHEGAGMRQHDGVQIGRGQPHRLIRGNGIHRAVDGLLVAAQCDDFAPQRSVGVLGVLGEPRLQRPDVSVAVVRVERLLERIGRIDRARDLLGIHFGARRWCRAARPDTGGQYRRSERSGHFVGKSEHLPRHRPTAPELKGQKRTEGDRVRLRLVLATFAAVTAAAPALAPCPHCGHDHPDTQLKCPATDMVLPLEGRLLDGKFRLIRRLGTGGMASVWLARNTRVDKQVALKLIRPEVLRSEEMVARFRSEAKAAGRIDHPNICEILDYGVGPVGPFIVLEYLRGRNLAEIIKEDGPLPVPMAVMILRRTLDGLAAVHDQGIIHRDLKPENVFLHKPPGGEPIVKLMDFGVAKVTDGSAEVETEHGALLGTPEYMAPEQFKGAANADHRTDVWGVGAIFYRALTGKNAFGGPTVAATLMMVSGEDPTSIRQLAPHVPEALEAVVMRCLAKNPDDRYQSVAELDEALAPFDEEESQAVRWPDAALLVSGAHPIARVPRSLDLDAANDDSLGTTRDWVSHGRSRFNVRAIIMILAVVALGVWGLNRFITTDAAPATDDDEPPRDLADAAGHAPASRDELASSDADSTSRHEDWASSGDTASTWGSTGALASTGAWGSTGEAPTVIDTGGSGSTHEPDSMGDGEVADGSVENAASTNRSPTPQPADDIEDPAGTVRSGRYLAITRRAPKGDHAAARKYCEGLASISYLGIRGWTLANPSVTASFTGVAGIPSGRYWTSARWRGRAVVLALPSGKKSSINAERGGFRPLCIARFP